MGEVSNGRVAHNGRGVRRRWPWNEDGMQRDMGRMQPKDIILNSCVRIVCAYRVRVSCARIVCAYRVRVSCCMSCVRAMYACRVQVCHTYVAPHRLHI